MDESTFQPNFPGQIVSSALAGSKHAFIPSPLPPDWEWPASLWPVLVEANRELARLDGIGSHLPNPNLLLRPLQQREALRSSSLEGTFATPEEILRFEMDPRYPESNNDPANVWREVYNYGLATRLRLKSAEKPPLTLKIIQQLHHRLLEGVRGSNKTPGEYRSVPVQIGVSARFVPPPPENVAACLKDFEDYMQGERQHDPLVDAFLLHYQFESIHPFTDGNGRVGRLLLSIMLSEWCGLAKPWLYMSAYFDANKEEYITRLWEVSTKNAWTEWIEFCLRGVIEQTRDTIIRCNRLLEIKEDLGRRVKELGGHVRMMGIVEHLFDRPIVTVTELKDKFDVTYSTSKADIEKLCGAGILKEIEGLNPKTFVAPDIMGVTFEDIDPRQRVAA